jgi:hypothetical protein
MKKLLIALAAVLVTAASYGQGTVLLSNLGGGVNAPVMLEGTGHGPGPGYTAQLFLTSGGQNLALTPASTFRPATAAQPTADRYLVTPPPEVTVPGVAASAKADFALRVWPSSFATYDAAQAAGAAGQQTIAGVTLGGGLIPPANLIGDAGALAGFTVPAVPEPTILALGVLGASALMLRRRK